MPSDQAVRPWPTAPVSGFPHWVQSGPGKGCGPPKHGDTRDCGILHPHGSTGPQSLPYASTHMQSNWNPTSRDGSSSKHSERDQTTKNCDRLLTLRISLEGLRAGSDGGACNS